MKQNPITIAAPLPRDLELEARVTRTIQALGDTVRSREGSVLAELQALPGVHFASLFVVPSADAPCPAYVVLEVNHDGSRAGFLRLLVDRASALLQQAFGACIGYPGSRGPSEASSGEASASAAGDASPDPGALQSFLERHEIGADMFYVGCPGRGRSQIEDERKLLLSGRTELAKLRGLNARDLWSQLKAVVSAQSSEKLPPERRPFLVRYGFHSEGLPRRLREALSFVGLILAAVLVASGLAWMVLRPAPWLWGLLLAIAAAAGVFVVRERPRHLTSMARRRVARARRAAWLRSLRSGAVLTGALAAFLALYAVHSGSELGALEAYWTGVYQALSALGLLLALPLLWLPCVALAVASYVLWGRTTGLSVGVVGIGLSTALWRVQLGSVAELATAIAAVWVAVGVLGLLPMWAGLLWYSRESELEHTESGRTLDPAHQDHHARVQACENQIGCQQNHLATVSRIREGRRARRLLGIGLRGVSLLVRLRLNRGEKSGVPAIHFARFVRLPDGVRLLFLSNFDGPFGPYLTAFRAVPGVTAIWGQTVGFPRARFLTGGGARHTELFKRVAREHQVESLLWYSAYPSLRVRDIDAATEFRERLAHRVAPEDSTGWVASVRNFFSPTLDEAQCDHAWREV